MLDLRLSQAIPATLYLDKEIIAVIRLVGEYVRALAFCSQDEFDDVGSVHHQFA